VIEIISEPPVSVELNHRGGPASAAVIHVGGQQIHDVAAVEMHADAEQPGDVTMSLTSVDGETTHGPRAPARRSRRGAAVTLSGAIAERRPDIDQLAPTMGVLVVHEHREVGKTGKLRRYTAAPQLSSGRVDRETGVYRSTANRLTEADRRAFGIRRNGPAQATQHLMAVVSLRISEQLLREVLLRMALDAEIIGAPVRRGPGRNGHFHAGRA